MRWKPAVAAALAALLIACGSEGANDGDEIRDTMEAFFVALGSDLDVAYGLLSDACRQEISERDFVTATANLDAFFAVSDIDVRDVAVIDRRGGTVTADLDVVVVIDGEELPLGESALGRATLVREGDAWRLADCDNFKPEPTATDRLAEAVRVEGDPAPELPGEFVDLQTIYGGTYGAGGDDGTAPHVTGAVDYTADGNTNPPAGGPHWGASACGESASASPAFCGPAPWGIFSEPWEPETLVHNLEHGGVVLWYKTSDASIIAELEELIAVRLANGELLVMTPYAGMTEETIALTSWARIDKFPVDDYDIGRVAAFINAHERRFNPEDF